MIEVIFLESELSDRQKRFADEYLIDLNASQASIRAGYSAVSHSAGRKNLANPKIRKMIDEKLAVLSRRTGVNRERVIRELARIAFANIKNVVDIKTMSVMDGITEDDTAAIAAIKVKSIPSKYGDGYELEVRMCDKLKALEMLGRYFGMFTDNIHMSGEMGVTIINDIPRTE